MLTVTILAIPLPPLLHVLSIKAVMHVQTIPLQTVFKGSLRCFYNFVQTGHRASSVSASGHEQTDTALSVNRIS